jgi:hypothetical protein
MLNKYGNIGILLEKLKEKEESNYLVGLTTIISIIEHRKKFFRDELAIYDPPPKKRRSCINLETKLIFEGLNKLVRSKPSYESLLKKLDRLVEEGSEKYFKNLKTEIEEGGISNYSVGNIILKIFIKYNTGYIGIGELLLKNGIIEELKKTGGSKKPTKLKKEAKIFSDQASKLRKYFIKLNL